MCAFIPTKFTCGLKNLFSHEGYYKILKTSSLIYVSKNFSGDFLKLLFRVDQIYVPYKIPGKWYHIYHRTDHIWSIK